MGVNQVELSIRCVSHHLVGQGRIVFYHSTPRARCSKPSPSKMLTHDISKSCNRSVHVFNLHLEKIFQVIAHAGNVIPYIKYTEHLRSMTPSSCHRDALSHVSFQRGAPSLALPLGRLATRNISRREPCELATLIPTLGHCFLRRRKIHRKMCYIQRSRRAHHSRTHDQISQTSTHEHALDETIGTCYSGCIAKQRIYHRSPECMTKHMSDKKTALRSVAWALGGHDVRGQQFALKSPIAGTGAACTPP